jgi:hypothetical protein
MDILRRRCSGCRCGMKSSVMRVDVMERAVLVDDDDNAALVVVDVATNPMVVVGVATRVAAVRRVNFIFSVGSQA